MIIRKEKSQTPDVNGKTKEGYFFTEDELYTFVNDCMQRKAQFDGTNFTPGYEVQTFIEECKRGYLKIH